MYLIMCNKNHLYNRKINRNLSDWLTVSELVNAHFYKYTSIQDEVDMFPSTSKGKMPWICFREPTD